MNPDQTAEQFDLGPYCFQVHTVVILIIARAFIKIIPIYKEGVGLY